MLDGSLAWGIVALKVFFIISLNNSQLKRKLNKLLDKPDANCTLDDDYNMHKKEI